MTEYYLGFSYVLGIGPVKFTALLNAFGGLRTAYEAEIKDLKEILGAKLAEDFVVFRKRFDPYHELKRLKKKSIDVISRDDDRFPKRLKNISDPPICIYTKGKAQNLLKDQLTIAVVGTRKPTAYGIQITRKITRDLVEQDAVIVSGLALGIDAEAHKIALENDGKTVAVLGCGVEIVYPPANKALYNEILESGVIISEFPPEMTVLPGLFIARNRIVSALSQGVLVVEGQADSGSLITARYAAEQGRDVFAVPSPITSPMSHAPHILLKQGAKLVTDASDILEEYGLAAQTKKRIDLTSLDKSETEIVQVLYEVPLLIDDITRIVSRPVAEVLQIVSNLELRGYLEKNIEGKYQIKLI